MARTQVLVVEDDTEIRELVMVAFAREGWDVLAGQLGPGGDLVETVRGVGYRFKDGQ